MNFRAESLRRWSRGWKPSTTQTEPGNNQSGMSNELIEENSPNVLVALYYIHSDSLMVVNGDSQLCQLVRKMCVQSFPADSLLVYNESATGAYVLKTMMNSASIQHQNLPKHVQFMNDLLQALHAAGYNVVQTMRNMFNTNALTPKSTFWILTPSNATLQQPIELVSLTAVRTDEMHMMSAHLHEDSLLLQRAMQRRPRLGVQSDVNRLQHTSYVHLDDQLWTVDNTSQMVDACTLLLNVHKEYASERSMAYYCTTRLQPGAGDTVFLRSLDPTQTYPNGATECMMVFTGFNRLLLINVPPAVHFHIQDCLKFASSHKILEMKQYEPLQMMQCAEYELGGRPWLPIGLSDLYETCALLIAIMQTLAEHSLACQAPVHHLHEHDSTHTSTLCLLHRLSQSQNEHLICVAPFSDNLLVLANADADVLDNVDVVVHIIWPFQIKRTGNCWRLGGHPWSSSAAGKDQERNRALVLTLLLHIADELRVNQFQLACSVPLISHAPDLMFFKKKIPEGFIRPAQQATLSTNQSIEPQGQDRPIIDVSLQAAANQLQPATGLRPYKQGNRVNAAQRRLRKLWGRITRTASVTTLNTPYTHRNNYANGHQSTDHDTDSFTF